MLQQAYPDESTRSYVDFFANNGFSESVSSSQYPSGIYVPSQDRTYIAYQGPHEDPYIVSFEHGTRIWAGPVKIGTSLLGQLPDPMPVFKVDRKDFAPERRVPVQRPANNNGKPAIIVDDLGYIHVSFGGDGGDPLLLKALEADGLGDYGAGRQIHARSKLPHDTSEWIVMKESKLSWRGRQPQFVKVGSELYHFVVHGAVAAGITYQRSEDHGQSWSKVQPLFTTGSTNDSNSTLDSWNCRFREGSGARSHSILGVCSYLLYRNERDNRNPDSYNGYYLEYDTRTHRWTNVKGIELTLPLSKEIADEMTLVFSSDGHLLRTNKRSPCPSSVLLDELGNPQLLFQVSSPDKPSAPKKLAHVGWMGETWTTPTTIIPPEAFAEASEEGHLVATEADGSLEVVVTSSNRTHSVVQSWVSHDRGLSWRRGGDWMALRGHGTLHVSALIRNAHSGGRIVAFLREPSEQLTGAYRKLYLLGRSGPVRRRRADADLCRGVRLNVHGSVCTAIKARKSRLLRNSE